MRSLLVALALLATTRPSAAQETLGKIVGTVWDATGAVLPGAFVRVVSDSLFGGELETAASTKGDYRFVGLPLGEYRLEVRSPGFQTVRVEGLRLGIGTTVHRDVTLSLGVEESVTVRDESLMVDRRKSGVSTTFSPEMLEKVPRLRGDLADFIKLAPAVSASQPDSSHNDWVSAFGSGINENLVLVDGMDQTEPWAGRNLPFVSTDSVEYVEILSNGASTEFGNYQGAVFNVVTRSGGRTWRVEGSYYQQADGMAATGPKLDCRCPAGQTGYVNLDRRDATFQVGGPLARDRAWIFGSFQYRRIVEGLAGSDPEISGMGSERRFFEKLTFQPTPRWTLRQSYWDGTERYPDAAGLGYPAASGVTTWQRGPVLGLVSSYALDNDTLLDVAFDADLHDYGSTPHGGKDVPPRVDVVTGERTGGSYLYGRSDTNRVVLDAKITHYTEEFLRAGHELKFGVQFSRGWNQDVYGVPGGAYYLDYGGAPYLAYLSDADLTGGLVRRLGLFAEDVVETGGRLTLNLGIRLDRNASESPDLPAVDPSGEPTGETLRGLGTLFTWNTVAPRLGFTIALDREANTTLRGSWGRFYQGALAGEFHQLVPGRAATSAVRYDPTSGDYSDVVWVFDPRSDLGLDAGLEAPFTDQASVGVQRLLGNRWSIGVSFVRKSGTRFTGWEDIGGDYGTESAMLPDGRRITVFPLWSDPSERFYQLTNPDAFYLRYRGLIAALERRYTDRWQLAVSYVLSESAGLQAASFRPAGAQDSAGGFIRLGRDPNELINAEGNLPNDRRHMFRAQGSVEIPGLEVLLGASFQHLSGSPWGPPVARVQLPQGGTWIRVEPRGSVVLPSQSLLDLRLSKLFRLAEGKRIEVLVDVFNALGDDAYQSVVTTNVASPRFGDPKGFLRPRRAMVGVKVSF